MYKDIYVCCPGNLVTGGTELLHQLVDKLRQEKISAHIVYYPFNKSFSCPDPFQIYNISQKYPLDEQESLLIIPEALTKIARQYNAIQIAFWWLSIDFYFFRLHDNIVLDFIRDIRSATKGRIPLKKMSKYIHFHQSEYARLFLESYNIKSYPLSDYLNNQHLLPAKDSKRKDMIAYNPKKGLKLTKKIIKKFNNIKFIPLENMSNIEIRQTLEDVKIYIDFGFHPGKDRFPREAVMAGCCIITGLKGSAANDIDMPISDIYKLDEKSSNFLKNFQMLVESIFTNFEQHNKNFNYYRSSIKDEKALFTHQVEKIFLPKKL
jgi:hypothetical protein